MAAARDTASLLVGLLFLCHTWGAWADVEVSMEDRVEVFRGETAQITCLLKSADGVTVQWFYETRSGERQKIYYQDDAMTVIDPGTPFKDRISVRGTGATGEIVLNIGDVQLEDELDFICHVEVPGNGTGMGTTKLKVFVTPLRPTIEGVRNGISVNEDAPSKIGTCEVKNGYPKPNITWYRNDMPLQGVQDVVRVVPSTTTESSGLLSVRSELHMKVEKEDKDDHFYCEITYLVPGGLRMTETNHINITVYYPSTAVSVWVESPKGQIKEGDSIEVHCHGNGNMPAIFSMANPDGELLETNVLVVHNVTRRNSGVYHCISMDTDAFAEISGNTTVFVNYLDPAVVTPADDIAVGQGQTLTATCNALSSLQTQTVWFKDGEEVSMDHHLTLLDATFDSAGTYICSVTVPEIEGMETSATLNVKVHGPPEIREPVFTAMEESYESTVDLRCHVRGYPVPSVIWTTSDGKILQAANRVDTKDNVESVVNIKVTSDITAICNASNAAGSAAVTFNITATSHTTTPATTTTTSSSTTTIATTTTATTTTAAVSSATVKAEIPIPPKKIKKEGNGVIVAVVIICLLLLAILGSVLYFLYKKGKICGRSGKQDLTKEKSSKDNIVVEMKSDNTEEAVLLGVNGEKQPPSDQ